MDIFKTQPRSVAKNTNCSNSQQVTDTRDFPPSKIINLTGKCHNVLSIIPIVEGMVSYLVAKAAISIRFDAVFLVGFICYYNYKYDLKFDVGVI